MAIGILWALLAPVSLVLAAALLSWLLVKARVKFKYAVPLSALAVGVPVWVGWYVDWSDFDRICKAEGAPVVYRHDKAEGIFLNSPTANSFGMRYLQEGFGWVEAASVSQPGAWVRYERSADGAIATTPIATLSARYEVREDFTQPSRYTASTRTQVIDRRTGAVLARAGSATFDGGRMNLVLGMWGMRSCPSAMRAPEGFDAFYHLARHALR